MQDVDRLDLSELFAGRAQQEWGAPLAPPRQGSGPPPIPFTYGLPDPGSFPYQDIIQATATVVNREGPQAFQYGTTRGFDGLLDVIISRLAGHEGIEATRQNLMITNGGLHALDTVCHAFVNPGDTVIVEAPCFHGALDVFLRLEAKPVAVALDDGGMRIEELADKVASLVEEGRKPKFIYTVPNFHNPGGVTMTLDRRLALLGLAAEHKIVIVEDDAYRELCYEDDPPPSLYALDRHGLVIRLGTFSKILAPGMRLAWALGPEKAISKMLLFRFDTGTSQFGSRVAAEYCREHIEDHIVDLVKVYREKRDAMLHGLEEHVGSLARWTRPQGGFYVWVDLSEKIDSDRLLECAREEGVNYLRGTACFPDGRGRNSFRLSFSFPTADEIVEGTRRLGQAMRAAKS
ncbi:MAG: PLP-dependent aminotransferase family protein [Chloroflexi bacterium]|nr:PLP-dependent aminotransferase family protein [Chloroflexota bacterium]